MVKNLQLTLKTRYSGEVRKVSLFLRLTPHTRNNFHSFLLWMMLLTFSWNNKFLFNVFQIILENPPFLAKRNPSPSRKFLLGKFFPSKIPFPPDNLIPADPAKKILPDNSHWKILLVQLSLEKKTCLILVSNHFSNHARNLPSVEYIYWKFSLPKVSTEGFSRAKLPHRETLPWKILPHRKTPQTILTLWKFSLGNFLGISPHVKLN